MDARKKVGAVIKSAEGCPYFIEIVYRPSGAVHVLSKFGNLKESWKLARWGWEAPTMSKLVKHERGK